MNKIAIKPYNEKYAREMVDIFYNTIHNINIQDYSQEQVDAWAPEEFLKLDGWTGKWSKNAPFVACFDDIVVGFAEFEDSGYIDCFYVHHEYQGAGVGSVLLQSIINKAKANNISRIYADVSITAKPFFVAKDFIVVQEQQLEKRGFLFDNFKMEKMVRF